MTKCVPNMMVNNVIWGDKYLMWHGSVQISCSKNNYVANIRFSDVEHRNVIEGEILDGENVLYTLSGYAGQKTFIKDVSKNEPEEKLFVDVSTYKENTISYLPEEVQNPFNSLKLWMPVKEAIIKNDMAVADEEKKKIEADQRIRQRTRLATSAWKDAQYFLFQASRHEENQVLTQEEELENGHWEFKNNFSIDQEYINSMLQEAEQIRIKKESEQAQDVDNDSDESPTEESTCSVQ